MILFLRANHSFHMLIADTFSLQVLSVAVYNHYKRIYNANVQKELVSVLKLTCLSFFLTYLCNIITSYSLCPNI